MKKFLPKIILILIVGGLSYSSYLLSNSIDNGKVVDQFTRFLEKKKQQKEDVNKEDRVNELQQDIEEIALSMEDHNELRDNISNANYIIYITIILSLLAPYSSDKEKQNKHIS